MEKKLLPADSAYALQNLSIGKKYFASPASGAQNTPYNRRACQNGEDNPSIPWASSASAVSILSIRSLELHLVISLTKISSLSEKSSEKQGFRV